MKQLALLLVIICPALTVAQALPDNPQPMPAAQPSQPENPISAPAEADSMWDRLAHLPRDQKIKIQIGNGRWERCIFSGATDAYLYCAYEDGSNLTTEWQISRANIANFKLDHDVRNGRIAFAAGVVSVGLVLGLQNTRDEGAAALAGMFGAFLGMIPGGVASCVVGHCVIVPPDLFGPAPHYAFRVNVPLRSPMHLRRSGR